MWLLTAGASTAMIEKMLMKAAKKDFLDRHDARVEAQIVMETDSLMSGGQVEQRSAVPVGNAVAGVSRRSCKALLAPRVQLDPVEIKRMQLQMRLQALEAEMRRAALTPITCPLN